jgi:hypothetical protein
MQQARAHARATGQPYRSLPGIWTSSAKLSERAQMLPLAVLAMQRLPGGAYFVFI